MRIVTRFLLGSLFVLLLAAQAGIGVFPTNQIAFSITPIVSASAEATHVLSAGPVNLYSAYFTNTTATAGFFMLLDATTVPGDGAVTPKACAAFAANSSVSISTAPGPMMQFNNGLVAVASSAATCFTKTTGTVSGFISGSFK
jgi:kynureninase